MIVLKLKTPFDPGMYDQGNTYEHVLVTVFNMNTVAQVIEIRWEYGTYDAATGWQPGKAGLPQSTILANDDFYAAIAATPTAGNNDSILMAAARECYEILSKNAASAGEVIDIEPAAQAPSEAAPDASATDAAASDTTASGASTSSAPAARKATKASKES